MLTIHLFLTDLEPVDAVRQKERELIEWNKKEDQFWFYKTFHNPDSQEYMIDFLCCESKDNLMTLVEFTIYRYKQVFITVNQKALLIFAYSKRSYGEEITSFFETFEDDRLSLLNLMILSEVPDVTITNK